MSAIDFFLLGLALCLFYPSPQQLCEAGLRDPIYLKFSGRTGAGAEVRLTLYTAFLQGELSADNGSFLSCTPRGTPGKFLSLWRPGFSRLLMGLWPRTDLEGSAHTDLPHRRGQSIGRAYNSS